MSAPRPTFDAGAFLKRLWAMDAVLVRAGFPPTSPWWRTVLERFFRGRMTLATLRRLVLRVGRRGGKSTTLCRVAVAWSLYGMWEVPPGDVGTIAIVSVNLSDSTAKLRTLEAILTAIGAEFRRTQDGVELVQRPAVFRCFAATSTAVLGFTSIAILTDEVAAWRAADSDANPAGEVFSFLMPTLATQPHAFVVVLSSPRSTTDYHYEAFERGDTREQLTAEAPTWVANPTITEEQTHALEPDPRVWAREYAAIPQPSVLGAFDASAVSRAFEPRSSPTTRFERFLFIDASSGKKDSWTGAVAGWSTIDGRAHFVIDAIDSVGGSFWRSLSGDQVVERFATLAKRWGAHMVHADQRESLMLSAAFKRHCLGFTEHPWTSANKPTAVAIVRRWLAEGILVLPEHQQMKRELLAFEERATPSGGFTFGARGNGHDDFVALLITAAMAEGESQLSGSPLSPPFRFSYTPAYARRADRSRWHAAAAGIEDDDPDAWDDD